MGAGSLRRRGPSARGFDGRDGRRAQDALGAARTGEKREPPVVFYYGGKDIPVFLLGIFAKNERINLSKAERNELAQILRDLAATYREGVKGNVQGRR